MRRLCFVLAIALLAGCIREPSPLDLTGEQLMVHSLLVADSDTVAVLLTRTLERPEPDPDNPGSERFARPVSAADVRLTYGATTLRLQESPEGFPPCFSSFPTRMPRVDSIRPGCYAAVVPGGIRAGERYRLEVRLNGGVAAEGVTDVPAAPEILAPAAGTRVSVVVGQMQGQGGALAIRLRYRVPAAVAGTRAALVLGAPFAAGAAVQGAQCSYGPIEIGVRGTARADSVVVDADYFQCSRPGEQGGFQTFVPDSVHAVVALAGYDSTYTTYARAALQESARRDRLQAGVTGALGLFAGAGVATLPVTLVPRR